MTKHQLRLTLWKDFTLRKRHPGIISLVFICTVTIFMIMYVVRLSMLNESIPTCQYKPRAMPSVGLMPFVQNFLCNINNDCELVDDNKELPSFENSKFGALVSELKPLITNESFIDVAQGLPKSVRLITTVADTLNNRDVKMLISEGIPFRTLVKNPDKLGSFLVQNEEVFDNFTYEALLDSKLHLSKLILLLTKNELKNSVCNPIELKTIIEMDDALNVEFMSETLCDMSEERMKKILQGTWQYFDLGEIFKILGRSLSNFGHNDYLSNIGDMIEAMTRLQKLQSFIPANFTKLSKLIPQILPLFQSFNTTAIDFNFLDRLLETVEPIFVQNEQWPIIKKFATHVSTLLHWIQDKMLNRTTLEKEINSAELYNNLKMDLFMLQNSKVFKNQKNNENPVSSVDTSINNIENILGVTWKLANNTAVLFENAVENKKQDPGLLFANALDQVKLALPFFQGFKTQTVILNNILRIVNNLLVIDIDSLDAIYEISLRHKNVVDDFLIFGPEATEKMFENLRKPENIKIFFENVDNSSKILCDADQIEKIFDVPPKKSKFIQTKICTKEWEDFLRDMFEEIGITNTIKSILILGNNQTVFDHDYFNEKKLDSFSLLYTNLNRIYGSLNANKTEKDWGKINKGFNHKAWTRFAHKIYHNKKKIFSNIRLQLIKNAIEASRLSNESVTESVNYLEIFLDEVKQKIGIFFDIPVDTNKNFTSINEIVEPQLRNQLAWKKLFDQQDEIIDLMDKIDWTMMSNYVNSTHWMGIERFFNERLNLANSMKISIQSVLKWLEILDTKSARLDKNPQWAKIKAFILTGHSVLKYFNQLLSKMSENKNLTVADLDLKLPYSEAVVRKVLTNMSTLIKDLGTAFSLEHVNEDLISEFMQEDPIWPCGSMSLGELFVTLNNSTRETLQEIESDICNPKIIQELANHEEIKKIVQAWKSENPNNIPAFWRSSSLMFQEFISQIADLPETSQLSLFADVDNFDIDEIQDSWDVIVEEFGRNNPDIKIEKKFTRFLDLLMKHAPSLKSSFSDVIFKFDICMEDKNEECEKFLQPVPLHLLKYLPKTARELLEIFNNYLEEIKQGDTNIFQVLGFTKNTGPYIFHEKLADIIMIFLNSFQNDKFQKLFMSPETMWCKNIFKNVQIPKENSVTISDMKLLSEYICFNFFKFAVMDDNVFLKASQVPQNVYYEPIAKHNVTYEQLLDSIYKIKKTSREFTTSQKNPVKKEAITKAWIASLSKTGESFMTTKFTSATSVKNILNFYYKNESWFQYTIALLDSFDKFSSSLRQNVEAQIDPITLTDDEESEATKENRNIESMDVLGFGFQTFLISEFVLKSACKDTGNRKNVTELIKVPVLDCPFDWDGLNSDLQVYLKNETGERMASVLLESTIQHIAENIKFLAKNDTNLTNTYLNISLWQHVFDEIMPLHDFEASAKWASYLLKIYKSRNIPENLLMSIDKNLQTYTAVMNGFKDGATFQSANVDVIERFDEHLFQKHVVEFQGALRHILKNPGLLEMVAGGKGEGISEKFNNFLNDPDKPVLLFQMFSEQLSYFLDLSLFWKRNETSCNWCRFPTILARETTRQITQFRAYSHLICELRSMNFTELYTKLLKDFGWKEMVAKFADNNPYAYKDFVHEIRDLFATASVQVTLAKSTGLFAKTDKCFSELKNSSAVHSIKLYYKLLLDMVKFVGAASGNINEILELEKKVTPMLNFLEDKLELLQPTKRIITDVPAFRDELEKNRYSTNEIEIVLDSEVNINRFINQNKRDQLKENWDDKVYVFHQENPPVVNMTFQNLVEGATNWNLVNEELGKWRHDTVWNFEWLPGLMENFGLIMRHGSEIMKITNELSLNNLMKEKLKVVDVLDGILQLLQKSTLDRLSENLRHILNGLKPLTKNSYTEDDLLTILKGIDSLDQFRSDGIINLKYNLTQILHDWDGLRLSLINEFNMSMEETEALHTAEINFENLLLRKSELIHFKDIICDPVQMTEFFNITSSHKAQIEPLSQTLCALQGDSEQQFLGLFFEHLDFVKVFDSFINKTMGNILEKAHLTVDEGDEVLTNLRNASRFFPTIKSSLKNVSGLFSEELQTEEKIVETAKLIAEEGEKDAFNASPEMLAKTSALICGKPLIHTGGSSYLKALSGETLAKIKDENPEELEALPTEFCRNMYSNIVAMDGGKIIWTYIKPMIRGKILYTPYSETTQKIIQSANFTLEEIDDFRRVLNSLSKGVMSLADLGKHSESLTNLQKILKSPVVQVAFKIFNSGDMNFDEINLEDIGTQLKGTEKLAPLVNMTSELMKCVITDRFVAVENENELEVTAKKLLNRNEFIAGVVFLDESIDLNKNNIPKKIKYKIRMDVDNVPSTLELKNRFWTAGAEDNFLEDLRYFRGFIQLQNMIDQAIVKLHGSNTTEVQNLEIYTKQFPYPCHKYDSFLFALQASQGFPVSFFFGLNMLIASIIRYAIWERESKNSILMNLMGLKYWIQFTSWFVTSLVETTLIMTIIMGIVIVGNVFPHSSLLLIYSMLLIYGISIIMFCYMLAMVCKAANTGSMMTIMLYYVTYLPFIIVLTLGAVLNFAEKSIINLFMSSSFSQACLYILRYETQGQGLSWSNFWGSPIKEDPMNFGTCYLFIIFDAVLYGLIGYGISKYRNFMPVVKNQISTYIANEGVSIPSDVGVHIEAISKIYKSGKVSMKHALKNINLELYKDQITTLLGHNGAGKTTLINILTGMQEPSSGKIVINDERYSNSKSKQQYIGICSQNSILLDPLSAREHLLFYAQLKTSLPKKYIVNDVEHMLETLGLGPLENEPVSTLSEGTRRRLSVAIAFIGHPTLVVLDEPSSGVDPVARRQIWDLIIHHKKDRTVLLTTHHFDEADLLSDRIIILHKGEVHCQGTPLSLKHNYGKGYQLEVLYSPKNQLDVKNSNSLLNSVRDAVANSKIIEVNSNKIVVELPFLSSSGETNNFEKVARILEEQKEILGYEQFSFNCITLEKVFQDICEEADIDKDKMKTLEENRMNNSSIKRANNSKITKVADTNNIHDPLTTSWKKQFKPLLYKRAVHYFLDRKVLFCAFFLPSLIVSIAMGFSLIRPPTIDEPSLELTPSLYQPDSLNFLVYNPNKNLSLVGETLLTQFNGKKLPFYALRYNHTDRYCQCVEGNQVCPVDPSKNWDSDLAILYSEKETMQWLLETQEQYIEKRYGGWSVQPSSKSSENPSEKLTVWYNNKGHHALPAYVNGLTNAILQNQCKDCQITTYTHPLQLSHEQLSQSTVLQHLADVGIAIVIVLAYSLVPASAVIYLVRERVNEEKRLQILSGVSPLVYWLTALIWDMFIYLIVVGLGVIIFEIFQLPIYVRYNNIYANILLLTLFGWATMSLMHLMEKLFQDSNLAFTVAYGVNTMIAVFMLITLLLMEILGRTQFVEDLRILLRKIFLVFPQFCLADGLIVVSKNDIKADLLSRFNLDTYEDPLGWDLLGVHYLWMFTFGLIAFSVNLIIENKSYFVGKKSKIEPSGKYLLETMALRKEFNCVEGRKVAVDSISFHVPAGQCFGLLGVNGAGKSTTFRMLTTELSPTSGNILIENKDIGSGTLSTGQLGYCPQSNAMDPKLTTVQSLRIYAQLKGVSNIEKAVNLAIEQFNLEQYVDVRFENLSGGNKRKVCAAVAVLGRAPIILMDEPTSGMDPNARELVANVIEQITRQNRSVILTSHSMEECEMLCSQVAIMIKGKIKCKGSPGLLKSRFGGGYLISIRMKSESLKSELCKVMLAKFPKATLQSQQYCSSQFLIPTDHILVSEIFRRMTEICDSLDVVDYSLVLSSLDQVFINLAQSEEDASVMNQNGANGITLRNLNDKFRNYNNL